jgi:PAS domain S-box-containing protein
MASSAWWWAPPTRRRSPACAPLAPTLPLLIPGVGAAGRRCRGHRARRLAPAAAEPEEDTLARARPPESATTHVAVRPLISRYFFGSAAMLAGLAAFITAAMPTTLLADQRIWLLSGFALVSVFSMLATRASGRWVEPAMATVMLLGITLIAVAAVLIGWGLSAPGIGFFSLLVCIICAVANRPVALAVSAAAAAALIGIDIAPSVLDLPAYPSYHTTNHELRLLVHLLTLAAAVAGGLMISSVVSRHVRSAEDREQRFRGLLGIAADAYWEIDQHYRLVAGSSQRHPQLTLTAAIGLGQVPWELAQFGCEDETLDMLQADLQTRVPFRDLPVHWRRGNGKVRHFVVSGEPRFNDRGMFSGYWGVARDVTAEVQAAQHALAATETRYQELFRASRPPLVLHRRGHGDRRQRRRRRPAVRLPPWRDARARNCWLELREPAIRANASAAASS